jgi:cytidine deaminase
MVSDDDLVLAAKMAREHAYAPYSGYKVGAALLCDDGRIFTGCNVENASYGLTNCAERTAIFKAVSEGCTHFTKMAVVSQGKDAARPCGACRQVMYEFAPDARLILENMDGDRVTGTVEEYLPRGFGPNRLSEN